MTEAVKRTVKDEMAEFLDSELMPSLKLMREIRDDATARPADRLAAAEKLADRRLGKSVQPFTTSDKRPEQMTKAELAEQAARVLLELDTERGGLAANPGETVAGAAALSEHGPNAAVEPVVAPRHPVENGEYR